MKAFFSLLILIGFSFSSVGQAPERGASAFEGITKVMRHTQIPDFAQYKVVKEKKKAFFDFMRAMVKEENQILRNEHMRIQGLFEDAASDTEISKSDLDWLKAMAIYYRVNSFDINSKSDQRQLLEKVDIIPESLFLAQSANESAWGTSRFAKTANNIFGQWCFTEGCGIVPSKRKSGETHEVQKFETINDAVTSYMHHLNSHPFYLKLRQSRATSRATGKTPSGYAMAIGLEKYSARGLDYVKEVRSMITFNKLEPLN